MNSFLERDIYTLNDTKVNSKGAISNYFPITFHIIISILIIVTFFSVNVLTKEQIQILTNDVFFQFYATLLLAIIGLINPFSPITNNNIQKILDRINLQPNPFINWLLMGKNYQLFKGLVCILIIGYFIYFDHLNFPGLKNGSLSGITILLIFIFIFNNIIALIRNPKHFRNANIVRVSMLAKSLKLSFFLLLGLIVIIFIPTEIMGLDVANQIDPILFILLVYNVIMVVNEYKIIKAINNFKQTSQNI